MRRYIWMVAVALLALTACHDAKREAIQQIACYANYSTVDWERLSEMYRPNNGDWSEDIGAHFIKDFPREIAVNYWHLLQNARIDFHQKMLHLRVGASATTLRRLDETEAMFDTIFVRCISQEYYMRLLPDVYNEVMPHAIDALIDGL